jgi:hypothetical protein
LTLKSSDDVQTIHLNGEHGNLHLGGGIHDGDLTLSSVDGVQTIHLNGEHGNISLGGAGHDGDLTVTNGAGETTIRLDGDTGDIRLFGADCAEYFSAAAANDLEAGTVVVMNDDAELQPCLQRYDTRVTGVISGAGNYRPGVILDSQLTDGVPVALVGKVYCKVDADEHPIAVGDLLTTSALSGHAMKATDSSRAFGAVLGKAMGALSTGHGLIPVLVTLQ